MAAAGRLDQIQHHLAPATDPCRIDGQVVLITGGAQGIGRAAAEILASKGARIAICDLDKDKSDTAVRELTSAGYEAASFPGDLLDQDLPPKLVDAVLQRFGKINVLVNGAGKEAWSQGHARREATTDMISQQPRLPSRQPDP